MIFSSRNDLFYFYYLLFIKNPQSMVVQVTLGLRSVADNVSGLTNRMQEIMGRYENVNIKTVITDVEYLLNLVSKCVE